MDGRTARCPELLCLALAAAASGQTPPAWAPIAHVQCNGGQLEGVSFDATGRRVVLLPKGILVDPTSLQIIAVASADTDWRGFAAIDGKHGLATDGERLLAVSTTNMTVSPLPPLPGIGRIDMLAANGDGARIAVSSGGDVTVFARAR